jgi:hypothetical protein
LINSAMSSMAFGRTCSTRSATLFFALRIFIKGATSLFNLRILGRFAHSLILTRGKLAVGGPLLPRGCASVAHGSRHRTLCTLLPSAARSLLLRPSKL